MCERGFRPHWRKGIFFFYELRLWHFSIRKLQIFLWVTLCFSQHNNSWYDGKEGKKYFLLGRPNLYLTKDKFSSWLGSFLFVMCFRPWLWNFSCIFFAHLFLSPSLPRQAPLCIWPCYLQSSIQCGEPRLLSLKFGRLKQKKMHLLFLLPLQFPKLSA